MTLWKHNISFVVDFFSNEINGGGELYNQEIINFLIQNNFSVETIKSQFLTLEYIKKNKDNIFIIGNFILLKPECKTEFRTGKYKYFILEHDWKVLRSRNPLTYPNCIASESEIINYDFYKNAKAVFCQSLSHATILQKNLYIDNIINVGTNLFSIEHLSLLEKILQKSLKNTKQKQYKYSIMNSSNPIKGTQQALEWCKQKNIPNKNILLVPSLKQEDFYKELSKAEIFVFFPNTFETYSRVFVEAKALGLKIICNKAIGVLSESYSNKVGMEMINVLRENRNKVLEMFKFALTEETGLSQSYSFIEPIKWPKVSLITTVFKGERFIQGFLDAFKNQVYPGEKELLILDANSPENEEQMINKFKEDNKDLNIFYFKHPEKIPQGEAFNILTEKASGEYISMCLIDDRLGPEHFSVLSRALMRNPDIDLVYNAAMITKKENQSFEEYQNEFKTKPNTGQEIEHEHTQNQFSKKNMIKSLPGPFPVYKKSMSLTNSHFCVKMTHAADYEFWLRCVRNGSKFMKVEQSTMSPKYTAIYFENPEGMSTDPKKTLEKQRVEKQLFEEYKDVFGNENYQKYKNYFDQIK